METIFRGEILDIVPQAGGIIFAYCKNKNEEKMNVGYKMITFETGIMTDVVKNIYLLSKFGSNYSSAVAVCENYVAAKSILLSNGKTFICNNDGSAYFLDADGEIVWTGEVTYKGSAPSDIAVYKNSLWACFEKTNVLIRFNTATMREELRIGGDISPFKKPESIYIDGDTALVASKENKSVIKVDLVSYTITDYKQFDESLHTFKKANNYEFVILDSGLYVM